MAGTDFFSLFKQINSHYQVAVETGKEKLLQGVM